MPQWCSTALLVIVAGACVAGSPARALAQERQPAAPAKDVMTVARDLAADDVAVRRAAATALATRWPDGVKAVPSLVAALEDEEAAVRTAAAEALAALGRRSVGAITAYLDSLAPKTKGGKPSPDCEALSEVLAGLRDLGPAFTVLDLTTTVLHEDPAVRRAGLAQAAAFPLDRRDGLLLQEVALRVTADAAMRQLPHAAVTLPAWAIARARGLVSADAPAEAQERWVATLRSEVPEARLLAARLLAELGRPDAATATALRAALSAEAARRDTCPGAAEEMASALGATTDPASVPVGELPAPLSTSAPLAAEFGSGLARRATAEQAAALLDRPWAAASAVGRLAGLGTVPKSAEPALRKIVRDPEGPSPLAALVRSRLGPEDAELLSSLDRRVALALKGEDGRPDLRTACRTAVASYLLAGSTPEALAKLRQTLARDERAAFDAVSDSCAALGPAGVPVLASFRVEQIRGMNEKALVAGALGRQGAGVAKELAQCAATRLPPLGPDEGPEKMGANHVAAADLLETRDRVACLRALAKIGPAAASVLKDVEAARKDPDPRIAVYAARAARSIRGRTTQK